MSPLNLRKVALSLLEASPDAYFRKVWRIAADKFGITNPTTVLRCLRALEIRKLVQKAPQGSGRRRLLIPDVSKIWRTVLWPANPSKLGSRWSPRHPVITGPPDAVAALLRNKTTWWVGKAGDYLPARDKGRSLTMEGPEWEFVRAVLATVNLGDLLAGKPADTSKTSADE